MSTEPVLLSYRALGLGDLLTAVPALRGLRAAFPDHHHLLAAPAWLAPLVRAIGGVDGHVAVAELDVPPVGSPDVCVDLHGRGPVSHRILLDLGPRRLIAFASPSVPGTDDGPPWEEGVHEVTRWCRLLAHYGIATDPADLRFVAPRGPVPDRAPRATLVHPGAKAGARRWPAGRFAAVARREHRRGRRVIVTGSRAERPLALAVAREAGLPASAVLTGADLGMLARCVGVADRVVCGDTGVAHLATALGTPSLVLFGPSPPWRWGPPEALRDRHRVLWAGRVGDPLGDRPDPGLLEISVADVVRELTRLPSNDDRPQGRSAPTRSAS